MCDANDRFLPEESPAAHKTSFFSYLYDNRCFSYWLLEKYLCAQHQMTMLCSVIVTPLTKQNTQTWAAQARFFMKFMYFFNFLKIIATAVTPPWTSLIRT
jgi:hypothetical protein